MAEGHDDSYHMKFGNNAGLHVDAYLEYKRFVSFMAKTFGQVLYYALCTCMYVYSMSALRQ